MAIALVQSKVFEANSYATTIPVTFDSNVTAGNLIDVSVRWNNEDTHESAGSCADGLSNTYTEIAGCNVGDGGLIRSMSVFYAKNITGGACTVTVTFAGSRTARLITVSEWSGLDTATPLDQSTGQVQSGVTSVSTTAVTPGSDGQLILGAMYGIVAGATTITQDATLVVEDETAIFHSTQYSVQTTAASIARTWTLGAARNAMSAIRTYKSAPSGTLEQEGFRWYEDNGSESTASAAAAQDANITAAAGATKRLRMLVNATGDPATKQYKLQWKKSGGSWADVL